MLFQFPIENSPLELQALARFLACATYWQYPHLPSFALFPRLESMTENTAECNTEKMKDSLGKRFIDTIMLEWYGLYIVFENCSGPNL